MQIAARIQELRRLTGSRAIIASFVGAAMTAVCAQIGTYLPGNPIPVTLQVFAVIGCGLALGSRLGALAQIQYLLAGLAGAPVFFGFKNAYLAMTGPTAGYIVAFIPAAFVVGLFVERAGNTSFATRCLAGTLGVGVIYIFGRAWFSLWAGDASSMLAVTPFIGLDIVKVALAARLFGGRG